MRPSDNIEKMFTQTHIETNSDVDNIVLDDAVRAMSKSKQSKPDPRPQIWRIIMHNKMTKPAAAAAMIIVGVFVGINMLNGTPVYAIEQTIEAGQNVRYLHFYFHASPDSNVPDKEAWLEYDDSGQIKNIRVNWYHQAGDMAAVWKEGRTQYWTKEVNTLRFFEDEVYTKKMVGFANRNDPIRAVETMYELEKKGDVTIEIQESSDKTKPIILTCTWKPNTFIIEGSSPQMREIIRINPITKLVNSMEVYKYKDGEYVECGVWTYPDYDSLFEPGIFDLEQEVPSDVKRLDLTTLDVGLEQTDLTKNEIAVKVIRTFFESLMAKDYDKAIKIYGYEDPDKKEELLSRFQKLTVLRIISIDKPVSLEMTSGGQLRVPCKIEVEKNGQIVEWQIDNIYAERVIGHPNRWHVAGGF